MEFATAHWRKTKDLESWGLLVSTFFYKSQSVMKKFHFFGSNGFKAETLKWCDLRTTS